LVSATKSRQSAGRETAGAVVVVMASLIPPPACGRGWGRG
jgi:hypothetical protein